MIQVEIKQNQAALIFDVSPQGEVTVEAAVPKDRDESGKIAVAICKAIGQRMATDEKFQAEIMAAIETE